MTSAPCQPEIPICPLCDRQIFPRFLVPCDYRKPDRPHPYKVYWCPECEYGQVWERPSTREIAEFYLLENYYTHGKQTIPDNPENLDFFDRLRIKIAWHLDASENLNPQEIIPFLNNPKPTICEIGCGHGQNLAKFKAAGFSIFGVEPDPVARQVAQQVTLNIFEGTAENLPETITNQKYDVILMSHVLEHCLDINTAVANVKTLLKDGGIYIVETPNCQSLGFTTYEGEWPWSDLPRHLNFFTPVSLNQILQKYGFKIQKTQYRGFCRQFTNYWLNKEEEVWFAFSQYTSQKKRRPNFKARAWNLLRHSLFASKESKYDSVRLIGVKL